MQLTDQSRPEGLRLLLDDQQVEPESKVLNLGMIDTLRTPHLRKATIVLTYAWLVTLCTC